MFRRSRSVLLVVLGVLGVGVLAGCGGDRNDDQGSGQPSTSVIDPGPVHVHGLGINPSDGALFIATHTGLFRAPKGEQTAVRVAGRYQDTMGFTVVGPDRFLGSGHPDLREKLPPYLGLIRSQDAGQTWRPISLLGKADFHILEASGRRVVGFGSDFDTRAGQLLVSDNGGETWRKRKLPSALMLIDLAISPDDADLILAADERALYRSNDAARSWKRLDGAPGLLGWRADGVYRMTLDGQLSRSTDQGRSWQTIGRVDGAPAAFQAERDALYVALHDGGTVLMSNNGGRDWTVRSRPKQTNSSGS